MANKIDISKENNQYARRLRKLQQEHHNKINEIQNKQNKSLKEVRKLNQKDLVEIRNISNKEIIDEINRKDERIGEIKKNFDKTSQKLNDELGIFKHNKEVQLDNEKNNFESRFTQNNFRQQKALENNYNQHLEAAQNLETQSRDDQLSALEANRKVLQTMSEAHSSKYYQTKDNNVRELQFLRDEHIDNYYRVKSDNEKDIANLTRLHGARYENTQKSQTDEYKKLVQNHQQQKSASNKSFENEYNNILTQNNIKLDTLDSRTKGVVQKLKEKFLQNANLILDKSKDPFYQFKRMKPSVEDKGDHYELSIGIPEHEKNFVQIAGKKRTLTLTFNRLHEEKFNDVENVTNIAKKRESYATSTNVKDIINASKIEKHYKDGKLYFTIPKA
jgi:hypothetical protein